MPDGINSIIQLITPQEIAKLRVPVKISRTEQTPAQTTPATTLTPPVTENKDNIKIENQSKGTAVNNISIIPDNEIPAATQTTPEAKVINPAPTQTTPATKMTDLPVLNPPETLTTPPANQTSTTISEPAWLPHTHPSQPENVPEIEPVELSPEIEKQLPSNVSKDEVKWALELEAKVNKGYNITQKEEDKYNDIARRLSSPPEAASSAPEEQKSDEPVSDVEMTWASQIESRIAAGYSPSEAELRLYQHIRDKKPKETTEQPPVAEPATQTELKNPAKLFPANTPPTPNTVLMSPDDISKPYKK